MGTLETTFFVFEMEAYHIVQEVWLASGVSMCSMHMGCVTNMKMWILAHW